MGMMTDLAIEEWQRAAGIEKATGDRAALLCKMSDLAFEMIKIVELERSGIRDGNGHWHGSDPVYHTMRDMVRAIEEYNRLVEGE